MKKLFVLLFLLSATLHAAEKKNKLVSPFPSTVQGITIPNTHLVAEKKGRLYRGMVPYTVEEAMQLRNKGINRILIFRNDSEGETGVADEKALLLSAHFEDSKISHIPFKWKKFEGFTEPCKQSIQGLKLLNQVLNTPGEALFFHCTVGEDRTGYLAALYRMVFEGVALKDVFRDEMCARGYAEGDYEKPEHVSRTVHENITVHLIKMAKLIEDKKLTAQNLDENICSSDPMSHQLKKLKAMLEGFRCKVPIKG